MINEFSYLDKQAVVIGVGTTPSISDAIPLSRYGVARVYVPTGWAAANLTFQVSEDNVTWAELYDASGNAVTVTVPSALPAALTLDPAVFGLGFQWLKIRSGTVAAAVNQADVSLTLAVRPL